jgi:hypothetical protein
MIGDRSAHKSFVGEDVTARIFNRSVKPGGEIEKWKPRARELGS